MNTDKGLHRKIINDFKILRRSNPERGRELLNNYKGFLRYNSEWARQVAKIILEILEYRDESESLTFTGEDLQDYYPKLKRIFNNSESVRESTNRTLLDMGCIESLGRNRYATYKVTNHSRLIWWSMSLEERQRLIEALENEINNNLPK